MNNNKKSSNHNNNKNKHEDNKNKGAFHHSKVTKNPLDSRYGKVVIWLLIAIMVAVPVAYLLFELFR